MSLTWQQSIGIDQSHLCQFLHGTQDNRLIHSELISPLTLLLSQAQKDNIEITIVSSFRSFERQLLIWNDKWKGYKPVYSRQGRPLNILQMSDIEKYKAISLWSALPGLSRHHWGTDLDIFATKPLTEGYQIQLQPQEFDKNGPCSELNSWLKINLEKFGFFRPYSRYQQGVSIEPWHISHISTAQKIINQFDKKACRDYLENSEIQSCEFIANQFDHYYGQYFLNICEPNLREK